MQQLRVRRGVQSGVLAGRVSFFFVVLYHYWDNFTGANHRFGQFKQFELLTGDLNHVNSERPQFLEGIPIATLEEFLDELPCRYSRGIPEGSSEKYMEEFLEELWNKSS